MMENLIWEDMKMMILDLISKRSYLILKLVIKAFTVKDTPSK
jgi:hypothetical protein